MTGFSAPTTHKSGKETALTVGSNDEKTTIPTLLYSRSSFAGNFITVKSHVVQIASEQQVDIECVHFPDIALVVSQLGDSVVMTRQFRYPPWIWVLEAPAGRIEHGEAAVTTAIRELREETGYLCESMEKIGELRTSPHLSNDTTHVFLGTGLRPDVTEREVGEIMSVAHVPAIQLRQYVKQGLLVDAKTIAAFVLAGLI